MKRFTYKLGEINFAKINEKCRSIFNLSDTDRICIKYLDQENDWVTIKTTEELSDAIKEQIKGLNRNYICLKVNRHHSFTNTSQKLSNLLGSFTSPQLSARPGSLSVSNKDIGFLSNRD